MPRSVEGTAMPGAMVTAGWSYMPWPTYGCWGAPWHYGYYPGPTIAGWVVAESYPTSPAARAVATANPILELRLPREAELVDDYPGDAAVCFSLGRDAYLKRDYIAARAYFTHAVQLNDQDARFWYFKALAEFAMNQPKLAAASAGRGKDLQARGLPRAEAITAAFERVPDAALQLLASVTGEKTVAPIVSQR